MSAHRTYNHGNWISNVSRLEGYGSMMLGATVNRTDGVFNNSSPVSSLPLTVYVVQGNASVIRIPVEDPDGDAVRCRDANYQECHRGLCTYFPYGVLDEVRLFFNMTIFQLSLHKRSCGVTRDKDEYR
jgi:hypothetical protein